MRSPKFDFIQCVQIAEFFSARYRERSGSKHEAHTDSYIFEALSQIHFEKTEAVLSEQVPGVRFPGGELVSYDDLAMVVAKLNERLTKAKVELIIGAGKPLGGGSK